MRAINETIKQHLIQYAKSKGWGEDDATLIEILEESDRVYEKHTGDQRWWSNYFNVVEIDGMLIGFDSARTTGDRSPRETGWEFDPGSICHVESKQVTTTAYEPVREKV